MADLGNLKILLDMATTGNLKSTLENVDNRLDKMREKASSLHLGFDDKSISAFSTKMRDIVGSLQEVSQNAGAKLAEGMRESVSSSDQLLKVTKELEAAEARLASSKERSAHLEEERIRRNEKLADVQRSILKYQEDAELYNLRHKTGIESKDVETLTKYLDLIKELKKLDPWNKGTGSETWAATTDETVAIVDRLAKKWNIAREEVEKYFRTFQSYSGHRYDFSFDDKMGLYNLSLSQRTNEFSPGSDEKLKTYKESARAAKDAIKELADEEEHLHHVLDETRQKLTSANAEVKEESAEVKRLSEAKKELSKTEGQSSVGAQKEITSEMKAQVTLSSELEADFKELLGLVRSIEDAQKGVNKEVEDGKEKKKKAYDLERLHQLAIEKDGQLAKDQVAVWGQMEALLKSMVGIDEKYTSELYKQLEAAMEVGGVTREQLGSLRNLAIEAQRRALEDKKAAQEQEKAARKQEQAARKQKQNTKEREAAAKRQAQLETSIIRIETKLLGINELRLSEEAKLLVAKMRSGQITQEEVNRLNAVLSKEQAILSAENKKGEAVEATNMRFGRQSSLLRQINSYLATYVSVIGAVNLIRNLVRITGEFEAQHVALRSILQDVAGADRIFYQLQELAVKSPFTFRNLTDYAKQLSAFSVPMNEIYDTTKRLADVSAGLGVDMSRIILAYGQIRSASFLRGQEVRQLTEAGIPVLQELAKQFKEIEGEAISVGKVFDKISARQVPFEMIEKMFKDLTSEGGKFYEMQEVLAETVKGKVSNLQDAWEIMLSKVGESNQGFIKGVLDGVTNLIKNYKELAKAIELAAIAYGTYRTACLAAAQAESMQRLVHIATGKNIMKIPALLTKVTVGLRKIPGGITKIITKLNPWAIAIAAVTTAVAALYMRHRELTAHIREANKITGEAIAKAEAAKSNIEYYVKAMKQAKEGTEEYNRARQEVINQSGAYISATDAERLSLQNVDDVWTNICNHIEEATKLQAMQSVTAEASAKKQEAQGNVISELMAYQEKHGLTSAEFNFIRDYIRGNKTYEELYKNPVSQKGRIFQNAVQWRKEFEDAERIYEETLAAARKKVEALYGTGEPAPASTPEPLSGWRLRAQDYLNTLAGKTRGVKISDETNLADLAENGAKALNDLRKALELIPDSESDYKKVEDDIKFWEKLSEAIYGPGKTEFGNSTKLTKQNIKDAAALRKEQIDGIKQSVQDLKEAKRWYDQLTPLLGSKNAETLLASFNFSVPKEGFGKAFQGYADQLKARGDENGARDVMNWANGREVGDVLDSAKAIDKYTEALKGLEAQTKRLNLTGFAQDLDKIIVDADSKNRQLETNWAQKAEELEKAKGGWIQRYRVENEKATEEQALAAWERFYQEQTAIAKKSIDTQVEYNRKVAQEQINDKANKWLEEMMKENNINLNDMGDKSLEQVNTLIERLARLASDETLAGLVPDELKSDAALINVEFSKLFTTIKKIANTKLGDLSVEKMKKTLNGVKAIANTLGINSDTSAVESSYSTLSQTLVEVANAQEDVNAAQAKFDDAKVTNDMDAKAAAYRELAVAQGILAQKTQSAKDAQLQYNAAIAMAGVGAFASAMGKVASKMKEYADATNDANLSDTAEVMGAVAQNLNAAAQGYAAAASAGAVAYAWIGAVIGGVSDLILQIVDASAKAEKFNAQMRKAEMSWALSIAAVRNEYELLQERMNTIFGTSTISKMSGWINLINKQRKAIYDFNNYVYRSGDASSRGGNGRDRGGASHSSISSFIGTDVQRLAKYQVEIRKGLRQSLIDVVPELFKENGEINFDYLETFKASEFYNQLDDSMKNLVDKMIEANNTIKEAMKNMADYLTSVFGQVGADISNSLITAFEKSGEVAIDTGEILSGVAKKFVDDWTQSFLTTKYLSSLSDSINDIWMDSSIGMEEQVSQSLGLVRDSLYAMQDSLPYIQQFYEGLEDQFHWADGAGEEIGDAIKTAMVEQNSSLIAGYINSMRADLSMQRNEIMRNISPAVTSISSGFNTHLKYMESVAGNVQKIWERLNLLTSSGSGVKLNARI